MELEFKTTSIFTKNLEAYEDKDVRFICNMGSSRSSKTISILQLLIYICLTNEKEDVTIVRQSLPVLRANVMKDFVDLMISMEIYNEKNHNKTNSKYTFPNGSIIKFISGDSSSKLRGLKSTTCFIDEITEISLDTFTQLNIRTSNKMICSFNPSEVDFYIFDLINREPKKSRLIHSTYKDNVFLGEVQIKEIEDLINVDPEYYRVFALGLPPTNNNKIYNHFKSCENVMGDLICFGLDFGFTHSNVLVSVYEYDGEYYVNEEFCQTHLTINDLITKMNNMNIDKSIKIYCDYSRPENIAELKRAGYKAENADKNVKQGIDTIRSSKINLTKSSVNAWSEYKNYMWKTVDNKIIDEPVKMYDDFMDALRYAIHTHKTKGKITGKLKCY
jgi:phage terminase large subunit